jgi:hypothetical protein
MGLWDDLDHLSGLYRAQCREARRFRLRGQVGLASEADECARQLANRIWGLTGLFPPDAPDEDLVIEHPEPARLIEDETAILARLRRTREALAAGLEGNMKARLTAAARERQRLSWEAGKRVQERREVVQTLATAQVSVLDRCPWCAKPVTGPDEPTDEGGRHWHRRCRDRAADLF